VVLAVVALDVSAELPEEDAIALTDADYLSVVSGVE